MEESLWVQAKVGCESGLAAYGGSPRRVRGSEEERVYLREKVEKYERE